MKLIRFLALLAILASAATFLFAVLSLVGYVLRISGLTAFPGLAAHAGHLAVASLGSVLACLAVSLTARGVSWGMDQMAKLAKGEAK